MKKIVPGTLVHYNEIAGLMFNYGSKLTGNSAAINAHIGGQFFFSPHKMALEAHVHHTINHTSLLKESSFELFLDCQKKQQVGSTGYLDHSAGQLESHALMKNYFQNMGIPVQDKQIVMGTGYKNLYHTLLNVLMTKDITLDKNSTMFDYTITIVSPSKTLGYASARIGFATSGAWIPGDTSSVISRMEKVLDNEGCDGIEVSNEVGVVAAYSFSSQN